MAFREHWRKVSDVVAPKDIYVCSFDFAAGASSHRSDYLALGLLTLGAKHDPALQLVLDAIPARADA